jgi:acetyl-CoA synthase
MITDPMTSCGCFECIAAVLPSTGGIMIVNREFPEMTPCGMKHYIASRKFIAAEGGIRRIVWMPKMLKEEIKDKFVQRAKESGLGGEEYLDKIADESTAATEEEVLEFITKAGHPVTALEPMF